MFARIRHKNTGVHFSYFSPMPADYYATLGVVKDASDADLKKCMSAVCACA